MSSHEKTLKLVTNLDRGAVEGRLAEVRKSAEAKNLPELASMFGGIEGMPRAQMETRVKNAIRWLLDKPDHQGLLAQVELIELNLPNLK
jgi:hypothetical protein